MACEHEGISAGALTGSVAPEVVNYVSHLRNP
jgi:hypothetical protein